MFSYTPNVKFIDLSKLDMKRLKAYRKSIIAKIAGYEHCSCGSMGCDNEIRLNKDNPNYQNLKLVRERVNKELAARQTKDRTTTKQKRWAEVARA